MEIEIKVKTHGVSKDTHRMNVKFDTSIAASAKEQQTAMTATSAALEAMDKHIQDSVSDDDQGECHE